MGDPRRNTDLTALAPAATKNFERRHLMDDQLFNHYYKKVKATGKDTYKEDLQNYRYDRKGEWRPKNTIIRVSDLAKLVSYKDSKAWVDLKLERNGGRPNRRLKSSKLMKKMGSRHMKTMSIFPLIQKTQKQGCYSICSRQMKLMVFKIICSVCL